MKKGFVKKMEEMEVTKKARVQIERYKRQYKIMEGSRVAYNEELSVQLEKQKGHLEQLKFDKTNLDADGNFLSSTSVKLQKARLQDRIISLLKQKKILEEEVKEARSNLLDMSSKIMRLETDIDHERLKRIDRQAKLEALKNRESKMSFFESQLSMETVELNKLLTKNRRMRDEMESLLKERARFKELLDKLFSRLSGGRVLIQDLMEQGTVAFEHREEAQSKLQLLRRKMVTLREKHGQAMRDLERELWDNIRSASFLTTKGQERGGKAARVEEEELRRTILQGEVQHLDSIYQRITLCFPNISDTAAIAEQYLIQEDENFAIFNYVNEVNCEVESIQTAAEEIKLNLTIEEERKREQVKLKKSDLSELVTKLEEKQKLIENLKMKKQEIVDTRVLIVTKCLEMYNQVKGTPSPFQIMIDEQEGVKNADCCLKFLEKRIRDTLIQMNKEIPYQPHFSTKLKKEGTTNM